MEDVLDQCGRQGITSNGDAFALIKTTYDAAVSAHKKKKMVVQENLRHLFEFVEEVYSEGQELMILVTELTVRYYCAKFIAKFGCTEYFKHNQDMMFHERRYGLLRLRYLREHRPIVWAELVMEGKLYAHPLETRDAANDLLESMMPGIYLATKSSAPQLCWGAFLHQFYNT